jgi:hypothetical protein
MKAREFDKKFDAGKEIKTRAKKGKCGFSFVDDPLIR